MRRALAGKHTVLSYRFDVDSAWLAVLPSLSSAAHEPVDLGCSHEELLLTDLKDLFFSSPRQETRYLPSGPIASSAPSPVGGAWRETQHD